MTAVTRIVEHLVGPPPSFDVMQAGRGMRQAIANCGSWPEAGSYAEYAAAIDRARRELDRVAKVWGRYSQRYDRGLVAIEDGPVRLSVRFHVAHQTLLQREECLRLLTEEPGGQA